MPRLARQRRDGNPERVLVMDDDAAVRRLTARILAEAGFTTAVAADGMEALEAVRLRPETFDAVVSDIVMPRMDGVALVGHLSQLRPALPVLLMSGYSAGELNSRGITPPCAVLPKPYQAAKLLQAVRECIDGRTTP